MRLLISVSYLAIALALVMCNTPKVNEPMHRQMRSNSYNLQTRPVTTEFFSKLYDRMMEPCVIAGEIDANTTADLHAWFATHSDDETLMILSSLPGEQVSAVNAFTEDWKLEGHPQTREYLRRSGPNKFPASLRSKENRQLH